MPTSGAQIVPAKVLETLRLLQDLNASDLGMLDETLGEWMHRPLGREALASVVLPTNGSLYLALMNFEPAGLLLMERGRMATRIRALAVAEDMRRRGLARMLLESADTFAHEADLHWLWMLVPNANVPATACALGAGYKRYRPQFLRRQRTGLISLTLGRAHVEPLEGDEAKQQVSQWVAFAAQQGDAWCHELASGDLAPFVAPASASALDQGKTYLLVSGADEVGVAHFAGTASHRSLWLWLDQAIWNTEREMNVLKSALDTLTDVPPALDIEFGSHDHLRASAGRYKAFGFKPVVRETVVFVRAG